MPKEYIVRLVYNRTHISVAIVKMPLEVISGITFRPFRERKFAEIVFFTVSSDQQVKGYRAHLMAYMKDYVKTTSPIMHFLDYEGGTLMQCSMVPRIRYLKAGRLLLKQKETVLAKIRSFSKTHIIHPPPRQ